jgi:hypothetical protein
MSRLVAFIVLAAVLVGYHQCHASEWPTTWSINVGGISHHSKADSNGSNPGMGIEARWDQTWGLTAGQLRNSQSHTSHYLAGIYTPWAPTLPIVGEVHAGAVAGLIDGYRLHNGGVVPMVGAAVEKRWQGASVGVVWFPAVSGVSKGAVLLMLKVEVPHGL